MKKLVLILTLNISLLFSPRPITGTTDPNGRYVSLNHDAGFFLNPDTYGFIFPAIKPGILMQIHAQRQNRPLFILAGSAVGYSITFLTWPFRRLILNFYRRFWRGIYPEQLILLTGNFYLGFILLNIWILWLALYFFEKIFYGIVDRTRLSDFSMFLSMIFICSNPTTKAFIWAVHQQMFNLLTPLICIWLLQCASLSEKSFSILQQTGFFLMGGLLLLLYGNFLLLLPVFIYIVISQNSKFSHMKNWAYFVGRVLFLSIVFFLPTILWILILKMNGVIYFNSEISDFHQIVWIPETLLRSAKAFLWQLLLNTKLYLKTMEQLLIFIVFSMIMVPQIINKKLLKNHMIPQIIFVFFIVLVFYWLLGYYDERLTNTLIPVLVCFWVFSLRQKIADKKTVFILSSLALSWQLYMLTSYGPFY